MLYDGLGDGSFLVAQGRDGSLVEALVVIKEVEVVKVKAINVNLPMLRRDSTD